ncbi:MAG: ATP-binding protein [candidate division WOR-3 bacterium]
MNKCSEGEIGYVIEVNGERALVELTACTTEAMAGEYYPGQPGSHVEIALRERRVIGIVTSVRMDPAVQPPRNVAECVLVGTLDARGRFTRGIAVYPTVGQKVNMVTAQDLASIFAGFAEFAYSFARPALAPEQRVYVQADRFFGQHIAVLGTTGCGKSCTVCSMLQAAIAKYPDTHIIVLDLHGEYAAAFNEKDVLLITPETLELPYWVLNFEEFAELTVDPAEATAKNQLTVLHDALNRARQGMTTKETAAIAKSLTVDSPVYYKLDDLVNQIRNWNIQLVLSSDGKMVPGPLYGVFDRFLIRFESKTSDPRFGFMFAPTRFKDNKSLTQLLAEFLSIDSGHRMAVIDLSGVPSEAVGVVAAVVSRLAFEFNMWNPDRDRFPILMVYEEAHNYVPRNSSVHTTPAKTAVERIAKEGRKYGVGAVLVSQRPTELSETVLSQCNTFVAMRLTNPDDQQYVRRLVPDALAGLMSMLPALRTGEALILGDSVPIPTRALIDCPNPKPQSSDVEFSRWWSKGIRDMDIDRVVKRWRARSRSL